MNTTLIQLYFKSVRRNIEAADVMPADKYGFKLREIGGDLDRK